MMAAEMMRKFEELLLTQCIRMMTSSNGNIFRVTGPFCGELTGPGEFPAQRPVTQSFEIFFDLRLNKRLSKQPWDWWFETPSWSLWHQCNGKDINVDITMPPEPPVTIENAYIHIFTFITQVFISYPQNLSTQQSLTTNLIVTRRDIFQRTLSNKNTVCSQINE